MAHIYRNGNRWRAQVDKAGVRESGTFDTRKEAQEWAAAIETELAGGLAGKIPDKTFADLLDRYALEVSAHKKSGRWEQIRINLVKRYPVAKVKLANLNQTHFKAFRDTRLGSVSAASVRREWNILHHACNIAIDEWKWLKVNPMGGVKRPAPGIPRQRLASDEEIERLKLAAGYPSDSVASRVVAAFLFAVETGMRAGEICSLTTIDGVVARLPMTKNGTARNVPLSPAALRIWMPGGFDLTPRQIDANFRKLRAAAGIEGLHFHDSRATAITRLSKRLDPLTLARMVGHKNLNELMTYYRESAEDIAEKL